MQILFWIAWVLNLLIMLVCLYETYAVSSNSSLAIPAFILLGLLIASLWLRTSYPKLALTLAGLPAGLALVFIVFWLLFMVFNNKWQ